MAGSVFERVEKKYIISSAQYRSLMRHISEHCTADLYPESDICSVYYDTNDHLLIRRSLEKPVYKEKLRIRSYGVPQPDTPVFVELKKKLLGTVYKRRVTLGYAEAMDFLGNVHGRGRELSQIEKEIAYCFDLYRTLHPAMFISYHRTSFVGKHDYGLRITFDSDVLSRDTELELAKGIWGDRILPEEDFILEVKTLKSMPLWLSGALDECKIYPGSFSKYGTAYNRLLANTTSGKGAVKKC